MTTMAVLKAVVEGGRVVVQDRVDLPDGTELQLEVLDSEDELDEEEEAQLDEVLARSAEDIKAGRTRPVEDFIAELRRRG